MSPKKEDPIPIQIPFSSIPNLEISRVNLNNRQITILYLLSEKEMLFNELLRETGINKRTLIRDLKKLSGYGYVYKVSKKSPYKITDKGKEIVKPLKKLEEKGREPTIEIIYTKNHDIIIKPDKKVKDVLITKKKHSERLCQLIRGAIEVFPEIEMLQHSNIIEGYARVIEGFPKNLIVEIMVIPEKAYPNIYKYVRKEMRKNKDTDEWLYFRHIMNSLLRLLDTMLEHEEFMGSPDLIIDQLTNVSETIPDKLDGWAKKNPKEFKKLMKLFTKSTGLSYDELNRELG